MTDQLVQRLGRLLQRRDGAVESGHDAAERERFMRALASAPPARSPAARAAIPLMLAAALAAAAMVAILMWPKGTLEVEVSGGKASGHGYVQAVDEAARLSFSDGTTMDLEPGSASRVVEIDAHGARLLLEHGRAELHVEPRPGAVWSVAAGPYAVLVTGTHFTLGWSPADQRLELALYEGSVQVRGPMIEDGLLMRPGQRLDADVVAHDLKLHDLETAEAAAPEPSNAPTDVQPSDVQPSPLASAAPSTAPSAAVSSPGEAPRASWSELVAAGKYQEVLDQANARGIGSVLAGGSVGELIALGDAARYAGQGGLAQQVLVALREHHPQSEAAHTAAFLLGRMAEGGSASSALRWYDAYLSESPSGAYAAEALGRKLVIVSRQDRARARGLAKSYLAAYPKGPYATVARDLLK